MDWLLTAPQLHSVFSSLGSLHGDTYIVNPNALAILEEINLKLTCEDQTLRTFRRAIGFGQNIRTDLIPLLENAKDDQVLDSVIRILVNLTVPIECLFSVDIMYRTDMGRHTIFELNKLLYSSKKAFTDAKSTKPVVEFMKHILESETKLSPQKCEQINNCLVLLRNILHIPESNDNFIITQSHASMGKIESMQNAILWNLFIQNIDKLLLYLMTCPERSFWGVTMVQLIALMYKDQNVSTLQKLLNIWFEASLSDSSDDNESNTSPPKQVSGDSSPMLTSGPTSDSSDNGGGSKNDCAEGRRQALRDETEATLQEVSRKGHEYQNALLRVSTRQQKEHKKDQQQTPSNTEQVQNQQPAQPTRCTSKDAKTKTSMHTFLLPQLLSSQGSANTRPATPMATSDNEMPQQNQKISHSAHVQFTKGKWSPQKRECPSSQSELSDCGYGTQMENPESVSTSSNDDDGPKAKPAHQKPPCNSKPRNKQRIVITLLDKKELRRKKLVKRGKSSLINMKGLVQHIPTDEDISHLLKEFTVDFLLKGYDNLVDELHVQLLTNVKIPIDTSHFFWVITYFLKFAAQLELDLEHVHSILRFDVISYLIYEGVMVCEQIELSSCQGGDDIKPCLRRVHLLVTAMREFLQAVETYKKVSHLSEDDREYIQDLQVKIAATEDIRSLFVLLIRHFKPDQYPKQYLQDLVVTNHILLLILDDVTNSDTNVNIKMHDHISQFATPEIMNCYGILLEDFNNNGEFVNDCIFTMMHHIAGDIGQIGVLFQPVILKTFSRIWEAGFELCDDWSDLIEYVINKFINTPPKSPFIFQTTSLTELTKEHNLRNTECLWTREEMDTLYWYYVQTKKSNDVVGKIVQLFSNNGNREKSRTSIIQQLLQQDIVTLIEYDDLMRFEDAEYQRTLLVTPTSSTVESGIQLKEPAPDKPKDDIQMLRDMIVKDNRDELLTWLQKALLECCYVKLTVQNYNNRREYNDFPAIMEPLAYHCIYKNQNIPIVPWNTDQANAMLYQPFLLLLHKLGFQLAADSDCYFARIPVCWSAETMFTLAKKLGSLDKLVLKFDVSLLKQTPTMNDPIRRTSLEVIHEVASETVANECMSTMTSGDSYMTPFEKSLPSEMFAVPNTKHSNSIIRFTPDASATPSVPNWLQLVMRSKCSASDRCDVIPTATKNMILAPSRMMNVVLTTPCYSTIQSTGQDEPQHQQQQQQQNTSTNAFSDDDSSMKSFKGQERKDSSSSGFCTQRSGSGNLDSEYIAMIASAYEKQIENDTDSIASDLTRMYVSDDDENKEIPLKALE